MRNNLILKLISSFLVKLIFSIAITYILYTKFIKGSDVIVTLETPNYLLLLFVYPIPFLIIELKKKTLIQLNITENEVIITFFSILTGKKTYAFGVEDLIDVYAESTNYIALEYNSIMGKNFNGKTWKSNVKNKYKIIAEPWDNIYTDLKKLKAIINETI